MKSPVQHQHFQHQHFQHQHFNAVPSSVCSAPGSGASMDCHVTAVLPAASALSPLLCALLILQCVVLLLLLLLQCSLSLTCGISGTPAQAALLLLLPLPGILPVPANLLPNLSSILRSESPPPYETVFRIFDVRILAIILHRIASSCTAPPPHFCVRAAAAAADGTAGKSARAAGVAAASQVQRGRSLLCP